MLKLGSNLRKVGVVALCLAVCAQMFAQDIIVMNNGSIIQAIVRVVGIDEIRFKRFDNPNGPTYRQSKSEIAMIRYEDGSRDVFNDAPSSIERRKQSSVYQQNERRGNFDQYRSNDRASQNGNRSVQNNTRTLQYKSRYLNNNQYNERYSYNNYDYDDDSYYLKKSTYHGIKMGANISNMTMVETGNKVGVHGGIFTEFLLNNNFAIQPEFLYSMQGAKLKNPKGFSSYKVSFRINYFNLPLMVKYYFTDGFSFELGPQLGSLFIAKSKVESDGLYVTENYKSTIKKFDFALNLGVSYQPPNFPLGFYLRYSLGLINIAKDKYVHFGEVAGNNLVLQVGTFVKF